MAVGNKYAKHLGSGRKDWEARQLCAVQLCRASEVSERKNSSLLKLPVHDLFRICLNQAHAQVWVVQVFKEILDEQEDASIEAVLTTLFRLYAVYNIAEEAGDFIEVRCSLNEREVMMKHLVVFMSVAL